MSAGKSNNSASVEHNSSPRECPLCAEALDETDLALLPCPCDYQICLWCLQRIRERENNKCPQCRRDYDAALYRRVKVPRLRSSDAEASRGTSSSYAADTGFRTESQRSSFCEDEGALNSGPNPSSSSGSRMVSHQHFINYKQPTICRLVNCPPSLVNAQILSSFRYFGKYGKLASVTICNTKGVDNVFLIYSTGDNAMYAIQDFNKYISSGRDSIWKNSKLLLGAAKHCIQSLRGVKCLTENCPFTHCTNSQSPKHFWKFLRKNPGELNTLRVYFPEAFIQELVGDLSEDSFFDRTIGDLAAAYPQLNIPQNVLTAAATAAATSTRTIKSGDTSDVSSAEIVTEQRTTRGWRKPTSILHPKPSDTDNATFPAIQTSVNLVLQEVAAQFQHPSTTKKSITSSVQAPNSGSQSGDRLVQPTQIPSDQHNPQNEESPHKQSSFKIELICPPPTALTSIAANSIANQGGALSEVISREPNPVEEYSKADQNPMTAAVAPSHLPPPQFKIACQSAIGMKVYLPPKNLALAKPSNIGNSISETEGESESFEIASDGLSKVQEKSDSYKEQFMRSSDELTDVSQEYMDKPSHQTKATYDIRDSAELGLYEKARQMVLGRGGLTEECFDTFRNDLSIVDNRPYTWRNFGRHTTQSQPEGLRGYGEVGQARCYEEVARPWKNTSPGDFPGRVQSMSGAIYNSRGRIETRHSDRDTREQTEEELIADHNKLMRSLQNGRTASRPVPGGTHISLTAFLDGRARQEMNERQRYSAARMNPGQIQSRDGLLKRNGDFWVPNVQDQDIFFNDDRCEDLVRPNSEDNGKAASSWLSSLLMRLDGASNIYRDNSLVPSTSSAEIATSQETADYSFHQTTVHSESVASGKNGLFESECNANEQSSNPSQLTIDILRNIYDTDCVTWSPQGRIFQIEYAAESVKLGTCVVGLRSQTHAVVVALRRAVSKVADYNDKVLKIDKHVGATFSGITSDAGLIVRSMRSQCLKHKFLYDSPAPIEKLVLKVAQTSQENTLSYGKRPFGVGLLIAGYDNQGPHIFETVPSGDYYEHYAQAFGARCQAAKTFLETHLDEIKTADAENLIKLALGALVATASSEQKMIAKSVHAGIVGEDREWTVLSEDEIGRNLDQMQPPSHPVEATS